MMGREAHRIVQSGHTTLHDSVRFYDLQELPWL
jgi:hypothetical protein